MLGPSASASSCSTPDPPELAGTAGAIRATLDLLGDRFAQVLYGDAYLRIDYSAVDRAQATSGKPALMTVLRNEDRWDTSNAIYRDGQVIAYDKAAPTARCTGSTTASAC